MAGKVEKIATAMETVSQQRTMAVEFKATCGEIAVPDTSNRISCIKHGHWPAKSRPQTVN